MTKLHFSPRDLLGVLAYAAVAAAMPEGAVGCRGTVCGPDHRDPLQDLKGNLPLLLHPQQLQKMANPPRAFQHGPAKPHP